MTLNATSPTLTGAVIGKVRLAPLPAATVNGWMRGAALQAEALQQALIGLRIEDVERDPAFELAFGGVVDDHLQLGLVAFAQEARQVGAHHQFLDALRFLVERAALQVARHRVDPDVPGSHRVGHRELDRGGAVRPGEKLRAPEGGLGEIAAQRNRRFLRRLPSGISVGATSLASADNSGRARAGSRYAAQQKLSP